MKAAWPTVELAKLATVLSGFAFDSTKFSDEGRVPLVRIRDVTRGWSDTCFNGDWDPKFVVNDGDLLVGMDGQFNRERWRGGKALLNQRVCRVTADGKNLDQRYLYHFLPLALRRVEDETPFVTVKHLSTPKLKSILVPLPTLEEQRRIAAILDQADALRAKRRAALAQLDSLTQSIFFHMFGDPIPNPHRWPIAKLGVVGSLDRGVSKHRPRNAPELLGGSHPLVQTGEIANCDGYIRSHNSTYSDLGLHQSKLWLAGTLCITIAANIAKTGILTFDACFPDSVVGFSADDPATVEYVRIWFSFLQQTLEDAAPEFAQKNINLATLRALDIPVPPLALQRTFASRLAAAVELRSSYRESSTRLESLFASLQHRAFRGEL